MPVPNRKKTTKSSSSKRTVEAYANMECMFSDGEDKFPKGLPIYEDQLSNDFLFNLVEEAKETSDGVFEFEVMTKFRIVLNKSNDEAVRKKRSYK